MKTNIILLVILLCGAIYCPAQKNFTVKTDERFELTNVIWVLAENGRDITKCSKQYDKDVISYFKGYEDHKLIGYVRWLKTNNDLGYYELMCLATTLHILDYDIDVVPKYGKVDMIEPKGLWKDETVERYLFLLNDFYRASNFKRFYEEHKPDYEEVRKKMDSMLQVQMDEEWFCRFYGLTKKMPGVYENMKVPDIYVNMSDESVVFYKDAVLEEDAVVVAGVNSRRVGRDMFPEIVRAVSRQYVKEALGQYLDYMAADADVIYKIAEPYLKDVSEECLMLEWLGRLFTIQYFLEHGGDRALDCYWWDMNEGFIWQRRAIDFMKNFEINRGMYPDIRQFAPQLVSFIHFTAENMLRVKNEYDNRKPYVTEIFPSPDTEIDLNAADTISFTIHFSKPVVNCGNGMRFLCLNGNSHTANPGSDMYEAAVSWTDSRTLVICLSASEMKNIKMYGFHLSCYVIRDKDYNYLDEDLIVKYTVIF